MLLPLGIGDDVAVGDVNAEDRWVRAGEAKRAAWLTPGAVGRDRRHPARVPDLPEPRDQRIEARPDLVRSAPPRSTSSGSTTFEGLYGVVLLLRGSSGGSTYLVDGVLNVLSDWTLQAGDELRGIQTGKPQDYVYGIGAGVLVLILLMRLVF
jgi:hypothetical protein